MKCPTVTTQASRHLKHHDRIHLRIPTVNANRQSGSNETGGKKTSDITTSVPVDPFLAANRILPKTPEGARKGRASVLQERQRWALAIDSIRSVSSGAKHPLR